MPKPKKISTLSATFDIKLEKHQIPEFRKDVLKYVGIGNEIFHNHRVVNGKVTGNKEQYPLIQYRTHNGYANIWGVNAGADELKKLAQSNGFAALKNQLAGQSDFVPVVLQPDDRKLYKLFSYVPFGRKENYEEYKQVADYNERIKILERIITSHIVLFAYGVGWQVDKKHEMLVTLHDITHIGRAVYTPAGGHEKLEYTALDVSFYINAELPDQAGIGNLKTLGYGILKRWENIQK